MRQRLVALLAVAVLAGACGGNGDDDDRASTAEATTTTADAAGATTDDAASPARPTTTTEAAADAIAVVLGAGRLTVGGNALVFDAPAFQVSSYLERALGDPVREDDQDCGPGRLHLISWPGLDVYLLDDRLVGWGVGDDQRKTDTGIGLGSSRAELQAAYPSVTFPESTLGEEFFVPPTGQDTAGLSGVLEADEVEALWSGATCVAR